MDPNSIIYRSIITFISSLLMLFVFTSCEDQEPRRPEMAIHYFPILKGNVWNYEVKQVYSDGTSSSPFYITYTMGDGRIDISSSSPSYDGAYQIMYIGSDTNIYNVVGEFLTTRYISRENSEQFLLSQRDGTVPAFYYMIGGKKRINGRDYIYAKDSIIYNPSNVRVRVYTFGKGVGITEIRTLYYYSNGLGEILKSDFERVQSLISYELR
ncbi:hypothetical protein E4S40_02315 [Algoriphagus kandeliae]|uniref:Uncharacterized protein n=1 Tax=Algoriphagus kandeliae TaxID=2562278 RepID=A0A4Y9QZJ7_9BACT|nr:hypothetical protein [Algoriphagus kandeliae]TFV97510.1 hypothetical protein E4S40_02315 [Algoriphagus kandeliae]